jgi:hypothetical protein
LATQCLGPECCPEPFDENDGRNQEFAIQTALEIADSHLAQPPMQAALDFPTIMGEINRNRPICCHISWDLSDPNNGHYNVIIGYDSTTLDIDV